MSKQVKHQIGNRYFRDDEEFILAQVDTNKVSLISLSTCNRWHHPVFVDDLFSISDKEFDLITDGNKFVSTKTNRHKRSLIIEFSGHLKVDDNKVRFVCTEGEREGEIKTLQEWFDMGYSLQDLLLEDFAEAFNNAEDTTFHTLDCFAK